MRLLVPNTAEAIRLRDQEEVDNAATQIEDFNPANLEDGRKKLLRLVAYRQGQAKFREKLFDAYDGRCAITRTRIAATLQAAHIMPFRGPETNNVQNGLLLRADIHNLFDLGLIQIHPDTFRIILAEEMMLTAYKQLSGKKMRLPKKYGDKPSAAALTHRLNMTA